MIREIIKIDADKCNGCGLCITACHEGAIGLVDGKAKLLRDDYCDGLGNCLPVCPASAISFEKREAAEYNEAAAPGLSAKARTQLNQWPVQIKLVPVNAPYFNNADLLIAADCTAYAYANFHGDFMRGKITLIGCPKLDEGSYAEKFAEILKHNDIKSLTVVRMEVPCCGGIVNAVKTALRDCGKTIPCQAVTLSTDGTVLNS